MGAANAVYLFDAEFDKRRRNSRIFGKSLWRRYNSYSWNTGDDRRHGVHHDRRWITRCPARNIEPDLFERRNPLSKQNAIARVQFPGRLALPFMKGAHTADG